MHELNSASGLQAGAERRRDDSPAPPEDMRWDGSSFRDQVEPRHVGSAPMGLRREGCDQSVPESRGYGCDSDELAVIQLLDLEDESRRDGSISRPESTSTDDNRFVLVRCQPSSSLTATWFELCEADDQLGQLPTSWGNKIVNVPLLPLVTQSDISFVDDFWREVESSSSEQDDNDNYQLLQAIGASIATAQTDAIARLKLEDQGIEAMAVIVEVVPEAPAGSNGRYTSSQKEKTVPRSSEQREFLRQFVQAEVGSSRTRPSPHDTTSSHKYNRYTTPLNGGRPSPSPAHAPPQFISMF